TPVARPRALARGCGPRRRGACGVVPRRPSAGPTWPNGRMRGGQMAGPRSEDLTSGTIVPYSSNRSHGSDCTSSQGALMCDLSTAQAPPGRRSVNPWLVLTLVCLAQFMVILDATIVNVALPTLQDDLHFSPSSLQWVVNAYTLVFGGFLLLGGRAADLF